jgi:putative ABC transport system permease protein
MTPGATLGELLAPIDGIYGIVPNTLLLDKLAIGNGGRLTIGGTTFEVRGTLGAVPDQITRGALFGIPVVISVDGLNATDVLEPGVLARYRYKMLLDDPDVPAAVASLEAALPADAGWQVNTPQDATADLERFFRIFSRFLTIVGLSALIVGGVGVSNAIAAYVTERQRSIATLKALGATSARILTHFLAQVGLLTLVGIALGLVVGAVFTLIALPIVGSLLQIGLTPVVDIPSILVASGFGILVGFAFAFLPLKRAENLRPALLFRAAGSAIEGGLAWRDFLRPGLWIPLLVAVGGIYLLALAATRGPMLVFWYAVGILVAFLVLRAAAWLLQKLLRLVPPPRDAAARNALKSIYRPGAPAPIVILSLGLGLALLLLIALVDNNLRRQLDREAIPEAPSFVFVDLFDDEVESLTELAASDPRILDFEANPMLSGRIEAINGKTPEDGIDLPDEMGGLVEGEIPLTASATLPERSTILEGEWWPADYDGEPLISVFDELREPLGLKLGDKVTLRLYGEEVIATVASFRSLEWRNGGINFAFVLTPGIMDLFPVSYVGMMRTVSGTERDVQQDLVELYPETVFLPVAEAIDVFSRILNSVTNAVAVIGGLAVVSGLLVLAGAMAAGRRQREADAVVMKVLGATRSDIVRAYLIEYGLLGGLAALIAAVLGLAGTWAFVENVLEIDFFVDPLVIVGVVLAAVALTIAVGTVTTWSALSIKPARFLREE